MGVSQEIINDEWQLTGDNSKFIIQYSKQKLMLQLGILGLGEGRSTISAALASDKYECHW